MSDAAGIFDSVEQLVRTSRHREAYQMLQGVDRDPLSARDLGQYYYLKAVVNLHLGNYDNNNIDKAIEILRPLRPRTPYVRAVLLLGILNYKQGHRVEGRRIVSRVCKMASELGDKQDEAVALGQLAWDLAETGKYASANKRFDRSIALFDELGDHKRKRDMIHNQANWCIQYGRIWEGLSSYLANPLSSDEIPLVTTTHYFLNMAKAYSILGRGEEARDALSKGLPYVADNKRDLSIYKQHMGTSYLADGDVQSAIEYLDEALELAREINCDLVCGIQRHLGECYLELCSLDEAAEYTIDALNMAQESGERVELGACYRILGTVASLQGSTDIAIELLNKSMSVFAEMDSQYELARAQYDAGHTGLFDSNKQKELIAASMKYFVLEGIPLPTRVTDFKIRLARALLDTSPAAKQALRSRRY